MQTPGKTDHTAQILYM